MRLLQTFEDLLIAAQNGDKEAENYLFTKLRARVLTLVQQRIWNSLSSGDKHKHDAEDLTADICLKIIEKYKTISFQDSFIP